MKTSILLLLAVLLSTTLLATGSDITPESQLSRRRTYVEDPNESVHKPPPHNPKPANGGSGGSSGGSGSGSGSGGSGGSGSGGSGSGGSGSGGSGSGSSGSSGGAGGSGSSGASGANRHDLKVVGPDGAERKGALVLLGVAAVAGVAIAAATIPKRRVETPDHPLKGSLNRRINLFSNLAQHTTDPAARPPRRMEDGAYVNADEAMV